MEQFFESQRWLLNNPAYFGIFFVVMWGVTSFVISKLTGWSSLADKYRTFDKPESKVMSMVQVYWGTLMLAGNIYTIGAGRKGLYLGVLFPFRIGHPPLLVPWRDIKAEKVDGIFRSRIRLVFGDGVSRPFEVHENTAEKIKEKSNGQFNY